MVLPVLKQIFFDDSGTIRKGMSEAAVVVEKRPNARSKEAGVAAPFEVGISASTAPSWSPPQCGVGCTLGSALLAVLPLAALAPRPP